MKPGVKTFPPLFKRTTRGADQVWEIWVEPTVDGGLLCTRYGLVDGKKQTLKEEITLGKNLGKKSATTPFQQACAEAESRWNRQLSRKGYGLDSDASALVRAASPMLAHNYKDHSSRVIWSQAVAQPKLNGYRCLVRRGPEGKLVATSRENLPLQVPHILEALRDVVDEGVTLDGELYTHGMPLNLIASACKKLSDLTYKVGYHVYDLMTDEDYGARYTDLFGLVGGSLPGDNFHLVETIKVRGADELMVAQAHFIGSGYEGAMLRHGTGGYEAGRRSQALLKVKTFLDAEFQVVDYKTGRGKFAGVPIFTCVTDAGHHFDVLMRGTMEERRALGDRAGEMVGRALTVKYQEFTKTAEPVPFHPVGLHFRDD